MPQLSHSRAVSPSEAATPGKPIPRHAADAHRLVLPKRGRAEPPAGSCTLNIGPALSRRYALDLRPTFGTRGPQSSDGGSGLREVQSCGKKKRGLQAVLSGERSRRYLLSRFWHYHWPCKLNVRVRNGYACFLASGIPGMTVRPVRACRCIKKSKWLLALDQSGQTFLH